MDALRDWGHARDFVEAQWMILQQDSPEDFVIATGAQYSVRQFVEQAVRHLGISIGWEGSGIEEIGRVTANEDGVGPKPGDVIVSIDPRYFRPTEVETLLGDPSKAKQKLGWVPEITFEQMVKEMIKSDLEDAKKDRQARVDTMSHEFMRQQGILNEHMRRLQNDKHELKTQVENMAQRIRDDQQRAA